MKRFKYNGFDGTGRPVSGTIEAEESGAAQQLILKKGIFVSELSESSNWARFVTDWGAPGPKIKSADLTMFFMQIASLLEAGLPLDRGLEILGNQKYRTGMSRCIKLLVAEVRSGTALSEAMAKQSPVFDELQIQMVRAGEASGHLELILAKLAEYMEKEAARRSQLQAALIYPAFLVLLAGGATAFILAYVIPKMSRVFTNFGTKLPWSTQLLIGFGGLLGKSWPVILVLLLLLGTGIRLFLKTEAGRTRVDRYLLQVPLVGPLLLKAGLARFARTMAVLGAGGVGVIESLEIAAGVSGNRALKAAIIGSRPEIREGKSIAATFAKQGVFPEIVVNMVAVGEETGNLDQLFLKVAAMYEFEVDTGLKKALSLLEPALIIIMGLVVAFIVISILVPIFDLGSDY